MKISRGYKFDLHPTDAQAAELRRVVGSTRLVYNLAWEQRANPAFRLQVVRALGQNPTFKTQGAELTVLRREVEFIRDGSVAAQQQALRDVDATFQRYFKGRKGEGPKIGFPTRRKKGQHDSFRIPGAEFRLRKLNAKWSSIRLPKVGYVKFRTSRPIPEGAKINNATVRLKAGAWSVSFSLQWEQVDPAPAKPTDLCVGIDRGVAIPLVTSDREEFHLPATLQETFELVDGHRKRKLTKLERRKRRAQRTASRRRKWTRKPTHKSAGVMAARKDQSKRYWKAMREVERLDRKISNTRRHWQHEVTTRLARAHKLIAVEKLNTAGMTKSAKGTAEEPGKNVKAKSGLNRAILSVGWYAIEAKLAYKLEERGEALIKVPARDSSRECSKCGTVDADNRKNQAEFECQHCGHKDNADHNAAAVIAARGDVAWKAAGGTPRQGKKGVVSPRGAGRIDRPARSGEKPVRRKETLTQQVVA